MNHHMKIAGLDRALPICPLNENLSIAGFVIFGDPELTTACAKALLDRAPDYDYLITAEAKGIPLAHEMARLEVKVRSITTAKDQTLYLDTADAELMRGKRILVVDDVISTGESLRAVEYLVKEAGGIVCGRMSILAEGDAADRDDLIYLEKLPLFTPDGKPIQ